MLKEKCVRIIQCEEKMRWETCENRRQRMREVDIALCVGWMAFNLLFSTCFTETQFKDLSLWSFPQFTPHISVILSALTNDPK